LNASEWISAAGGANCWFMISPECGFRSGRE
jgi:hypothetical protein